MSVSKTMAVGDTLYLDDVAFFKVTRLSHLPYKVEIVPTGLIDCEVISVHHVIETKANEPTTISLGDLIAIPDSDITVMPTRINRGVSDSAVGVKMSCRDISGKVRFSIN